MHDWLTHGAMSCVDGLSEGFADYLAVSYTRSLGLWLPDDPEYHWVHKWDSHNKFWDGRVVNHGATWPDVLKGDSYTNS